MSSNKHRLITRSDFDGLVCAVLLKEIGAIDEVTFVHPKDMQDGKIKVTENDILSNLPFVPSCFMAFDHHVSETERIVGDYPNYINNPDAPSAARVVYNYYGGPARFLNISDELMAAVDKADSANYTLEDILYPSDWVLLSFLLDSRTGLGRFREFKISNYQLMMNMVDYFRDHAVAEILSLPDVKERVDLYNEHTSKATEQIKRCAKLEGDIVELDFKNEPIIYAANRFLVYALFPTAAVSIHSVHNNTKDRIVFAVGKSILNRRLKQSIGRLMLELGGGGHDGAGTCQIDFADAETTLSYIKTRLRD
ncbi:MAG: exopolyphosphatase [Candidatus Pacebacteria bacterium]|nr:exopolyphosphatase [Candidatus Paceibacterota bacterium]